MIPDCSTASTNDQLAFRGNEKLGRCSVSRALSGALVRRSPLLAFLAVEEKTEHMLTSVCGFHPMANHPRRIVADVLIVPARELSNPMAFVVGVIASDRLLHC